MSTITLNGTAFYPSDAPKTLTKIGVLKVSANGSRRWLQRMNGATAIHKRGWELSWNDVPESVRSAVETIARLTSTFVYSDQNGTTATVQCEDECYGDSVSYIAPDNVTLLYNVKLTIYEA